MKILLVACLLFGAAICSPIPGDVVIDRYLRGFSDRSARLDPDDFPGIKFNSGEIRFGTLARSEPSFFTHEDPDGYGLDLHVGASQATFTLKGMEMEGRTFDGVIEVSGLSAHLQLMLHVTSCKAHVDLDFEPGVNAVLHSTSLPEFEGRNVTQAFMERLNAMVEHFKQFANKYMEEGCRKRL